MKINLPTVTLIALTGIAYQPEEHKKAIDKCCEGIDFGAVKVITDSRVTNVDAWNKLIIYDLWRYVETSHAFLFHADGYIINPFLWQDKWLDYDYCGAPWPLPTDDYSYRTPKGEIIRVGNSVSIRSKKLLKLPTELGLEFKPYYGNTNEDGKLCVEWRDILMEHGIKFAPLEVAKYFSKEHEIPENEGIETFAYHAVG